MLPLNKAIEIAKKSERLQHSIAVGAILKTLAELWSQDQELWELVGILHDINWPETRNKKEMHGVTAAAKLEGKLPAEALYAIKSHDYRTGFKPVSGLDNALIFADALAHIFSHIDASIPFQYPMFLLVLERETEKGRPWMQKIILDYINENKLSQCLVEKLWKVYEKSTSTG